MLFIHRASVLFIVTVNNFTFHWKCQFSYGNIFNFPNSLKNDYGVVLENVSSIKFMSLSLSLNVSVCPFSISVSVCLYVCVCVGSFPCLIRTFNFSQLTEAKYETTEVQDLLKTQVRVNVSAEFTCSTTILLLLETSFESFFCFIFASSLLLCCFLFCKFTTTPKSWVAMLTNSIYRSPWKSYL